MGHKGENQSGKAEQEIALEPAPQIEGVFKRRELITSRPPHPILGFGWVGWMLVALFLSLAIPTALGVDLRIYVLDGINMTLGADAVLSTSKVLRFFNLANGTDEFLFAIIPRYPEYTLTIWMSWFVAIALHLGRRRSPWLTACTLVLPVAIPLVGYLWVQHGSAINIVPTISAPFVDTSSWGRDSRYFFLVDRRIAFILLAAIWLTIVFRTRLHSLIIGTLFLSGLGYIIAFAYFRVSNSAHPFTTSYILLDQSIAFLLSYFGLIWHVHFGSALVWASWRERRHWRQPGACPSCHYDMSESDNPVCPECGEFNEVDFIMPKAMTSP